MRVRSLIFLTNLLFAISGCATEAPPRQALAAPAAVSAPQAPATTPPAALSRTEDYLTPASLNLYRLLPPPPEAGSAQERAELDELLKIQAGRSPAAAQRALDDATVSIFRFADALGNPPGFTPSQVPLTAQLFQRIGRAESLFINAAKDAYGRPRPFLTEPRLAPVAPKLPSASYPSGHTTWRWPAPSCWRTCSRSSVRRSSRGPMSTPATARSAAFTIPAMSPPAIWPARRWRWSCCIPRRSWTMKWWRRPSCASYWACPRCPGKSCIVTR